MAKTSLVYPLDIERYSCYNISEAEDEPTSPTSDQPLDYGKELIDMNVTIETKVCTKCGEDKPLSEYGKRKDAKDGHRNDCKACSAAYQKAYREANHEKLAAQQKAYYEANRHTLLSQKKDYYVEKRSEILSYKQDYYQANRDRILAKDKAYHWSNRDKVLAAMKERHANRWANDPQYRERFATAALRRRRLLAAANQEPYTREEIFARDNWTCGLCQEPIDSELRYPDSGYASIDHIIPVSHGGDDTPDNVQAAHLSCNRAKGNRVELEDLQAA